MKNWRPDGWDALDIYAAAEHIGMTGTDLVEAGADAMYEAIWKLAKESPTGTFTFDTNTINIFEGNSEDKTAEG